MIRPLICLLFFLAGPAIANSSKHPAHELTLVIEKANHHLKSHNIKIADYRITDIESVVLDKKYVGPDVWRVTYKSRNLFPTSPNELMGLGGIIWVLHDAANESFSVTYGE